MRDLPRWQTADRVDRSGLREALAVQAATGPMPPGLHLDSLLRQLYTGHSGTAGMCAGFQGGVPPALPPPATVGTVAGRNRVSR